MYLSILTFNFNTVATDYTPMCGWRFEPAKISFCISSLRFDRKSLRNVSSSLIEYSRLWIHYCMAIITTITRLQRVKYILIKSIFKLSRQHPYKCPAVTFLKLKVAFFDSTYVLSKKSRLIFYWNSILVLWSSCRKKCTISFFFANSTNYRHKSRDSHTTRLLFSD